MFQATGPPVDDVALKHDDFNLPCLPWEIVIKTVPSKFCTRLDIQNVPHFLKDLRPEEIDDNSKCLWTSLREAFVHAGVVALSTSEDDVRKETLTVEHTHCTLHKSEGGIFWDENKSKNYLQSMNKPQTRATPFEVYLAARRYKCRILLYFKDTWFQFSENEFAPVILLEASVNREETFRFQWYKTAFEIFKLESSIEHDRFPSLASCIRAALCQNDVRPASAPSFFSHKFFAEMKEVLPSAELSAQEKTLAQEVANFYNVKVQFFTASPLFSKPEHEFTPTVYIDQDPKPPTIMIFHCHENVAVSWISRAFSRTKEPGGREKVPVSCKVEITELFKELFAYPKHFERFFAALQQSATKQRVSDVDKMKSFFYKCFRYFYSSTPLIDCHKEMFGRTPPTVPDCTSQTSAEIPQKVSEVWDAIKIKCRSEFQKAGTVEKSAHPLASFVFWIMSHCRIDHDCHGTSIIQNFLEGEPGSFPKMVDFLRILYEYRVWHFFEKEGDYTYQCMFEGKQHEYLFSLCNCEAPNALNDFAKLQLESSFMTSRWLRRNTGRSYKLWGHMSDHEYDKCEVQKCTSKNEKWRHMIYAYAIMALLWNEYNGNKEGPIGNYPDRRDSEIGRMLDPASFQSLLEHTKSSASAQANGESLQKILKDLEKAKFVFPSKQGEKPVDYHGHNIVALAVGKRGDILRIAYNHNTLFSSTVDHAEERLIDGLYKDPEAFVQKSHARIYNVSASRKQKMEVEKHMQHISVYTSLEQCQQCAGKFHLALVPEVIFCQRDWEIQLLQQKLYEQHHKCRPVPASFFGFSPYEELALGYLNYCEKIDASGENGVEFFRFDEKEKPVPAKKTMPYFLCSNDAQQIFRRGSFIFHRVLFILYHQDQGNRPRFTKRILNDDLLQPSDADIPSFFYRETDLGVTVTKDDVKSLIEACNLDVSDWMATVYDEKSPTWNDEVKDDGYPSVQNSPHASIRHRNGSAVHQSVVADDLDASLIRNFRPSLRIKQNRLCQDELISHRRRWTDILFKQRCTLKFFFDKYAVIDELDIDRNIGPLGEIRSVYLGRASSGSASLKGTFDVTFSSVDEAKKVKEYFRNIACKSGTIFLKDESVVSPHKRKKVVAAILSAACWIYSIREPNECELFISYSDVGALAPSESFDKIDEKIERQFPGQITSTKVRTLKFSNVSSKRRMQKYFFGQPRIFFSHSIPLHHPWPGDQMHSDAPYYLSLISRIDVSEGELLELLRKCVTRNRLKVLPPHFRIHSSKLTTCNSNKTLKWLHFVSQTPAAKTAAVVDWKLWNVKFKSKFEFVEEGLQSFLAGMGTNKFCQSFPQCVFDFAFEVGDMPCSIRWNPFSISKMSVEQQKIFKWDSSTHAFCLTIVMDKSLNHNQKLIRISPLELRKRTDFGKQLAELKELNFMVCQDFSIFQIDKVPEDALREIKIDENCIATLIVSDMLITNHHDVEYLWENWAFVPAIKKRILAQQQDFWGGDIQQILKQADEDKQPYNLPRNMIPFVQFMDFLKIAKSKNVFGFAIQSLPNPNPNPNPNLPIMNFRTPTKGVAFGCQYCGICTVFTGVDVDFCSGFSFRCIGHITQEKTRDEIPSFGKYVTELSENREHNDANVFVSEAKINSKGNSLIEKIDFLEKQLNLIMSVQSSVSFDNVIKEKTITSDEGVFKSVCQQDNVPSYNLFLNLVLRRDSFDGSAHVAFRIDGLPNFQAMTVDVQILGEVFCSTTDTSAPVPCTPVANSIKPTLAVDQESNFRLYGRLRCLPEKKDPEGGVIPANVLRYFFEPEYFWCDYQNTWAAPVPFPTIDVIIKGPVEQDHFFILRHVNSWDFEELQSFPLRELMKLLKDLQMERIKLHANDKKSSRIASGRKSGQSGALKWFLHFDEHQKAKTIGEKILFANLVRVDCTGKICATYSIPIQFNFCNDTSFFPNIECDIDKFLTSESFHQKFIEATNARSASKRKQSKEQEKPENIFAEFVMNTLLGIGSAGDIGLNPLTQMKISDSLKEHVLREARKVAGKKQKQKAGAEVGKAATLAAEKGSAVDDACEGLAKATTLVLEVPLQHLLHSSPQEAHSAEAKLAEAKTSEALDAAALKLQREVQSEPLPSQSQEAMRIDLFIKALSDIFPEVPFLTEIHSILEQRDRDQHNRHFDSSNFRTSKERNHIRNLGSQFRDFIRAIREAFSIPMPQADPTNCWKTFQHISRAEKTKTTLPRLAATLIEGIVGNSGNVSFVSCSPDASSIATCKEFLKEGSPRLLDDDVTEEFWRSVQQFDLDERWQSAYGGEKKSGNNLKSTSIQEICNLNAKIKTQINHCLDFDNPTLFPEKSAIQTVETFKFFMQDDWFDEIQPKHVEWLLEKGKSLERACDFATALKYYFAGNVYFSRLDNLGRAFQGTELKVELKSLYDALLPMTNAEAYSKALESVHYQNVVLKRGTMSK